MAFEIDFIAVGTESSKSGDAIALRYGNLNGPRAEQRVCIIDGGTLETGDFLVGHMWDHFGTDQVDYIIATHPDNDHVSGLRTVLDQLNVGTLYMHQPWEHATDIKDLFVNKSLTPIGLEKKLEKSLETAHELQQIAESNGTNIIQPFAGLALGDYGIVLGPSETYYQGLIPDFRRTPKGLMESTFQAFKSGAEAVKEWIEENFEDPQSEKIDDTHKDTSAENNSSVISLFIIDGHQLIFTGDAGVPALSSAFDYAGLNGITLRGSRFFQVPHHGSKHNITSELLNRVGCQTAFISAAKDGRPKHPSQRVINALLRRQTAVFSTEGNGLRHHHEAGERAGWSAAVPLEFIDRFEE